MRGKYLAILVVIVVLGLILLGRAGNTLVDWLWFSSIGYEGVFWTIFTARTGLFLAVFAASTAVFWLSGRLALRFARRAGARPPSLSSRAGTPATGTPALPAGTPRNAPQP